MKQENNLVLFILLELCLLSIHFQVFSIIELHAECEKVFRKNECNYYVSESFRNACEKKDFSSLIEWQKLCKKNWQLEYIGWGEAIDFLNNENLFSEKTKLMYGKWIGTLCEGEVYCRKVIPGENYEK